MNVCLFVFLEISSISSYLQCFVDWILVNRATVNFNFGRNIKCRRKYENQSLYHSVWKWYKVCSLVIDLSLNRKMIENVFNFRFVSMKMCLNFKNSFVLHYWIFRYFHLYINKINWFCQVQSFQLRWIQCNLLRTLTSWGEGERGSEFLTILDRGWEWGRKLRKSRTS